MVSRIIGVALVMVALSCGNSYAAELFARGVYWPQERVAWLAARAGQEVWAYTDHLLGELHDRDHCNLIWAVNVSGGDLKRLAAAGAAHGVQVVGTPEPVIWWRQHRTPEFAVKCAQETATALSQTDGLYAYVLIDEPRPWELSYLDAIRRELAELDPTRPSLIVTMRPDTPAAIHRTGFPIITCDVYPFFFEGDPNGPNPAPASRRYYRETTESLGRQCVDAGKTFWVMPGAFSEIWGDWYYDDKMNVVAQPGAYLHWRMPTPGETRWQIWQGIAAGARGVVFFVLFPPGNDRTAQSAPTPPAGHPYPKITQTVTTSEPAALLHVNSSPTPQMTAMGEAFADLERLAPVLQSLRPSGCPAAFAREPLRARTFSDAQGNLYAAVVNDNTDAPVSGPITILPGIERVRNLRANSDIPLTPADRFGLQLATVTLEAGGGTLLQLVAEPARRPLATAQEDFSAPVLCGSVHDARVRVLQSGTGWQHEVVQSDDADPPAAGTLTCDVSVLTGDPQAGRPSGPIYVVYQGRSDAFESVELSFSDDGQAFTRASVDEFDTPIPLPPQAKSVQFTLRQGGSLSGFTVIATEAAH